MPKWFSRKPVFLVSSLTTMSADSRASNALWEISPRLPIGVETSINIEANRRSSISYVIAGYYS